MKYSRRDFNKLSLVAAASTLASPRSRAGYGNVPELFDGGDATDLAQYVRQGLVSPTELLEEAIHRVELINPQINAVSQKHYDFGKSAIEKGLPDGPFTGVPFLLKDLGVFLTGTVTSHGSRLHGAEVARHTSLLVERYRQAGLVIFGKTNTPEYGLALTTENRFLGDCLNPWNTAHSTGGSSGGSAAAVASRIVPLAHGTDGGGSIRVPANHCGVFGFKPSRGVTPGVSGAGMSIGHALSRSVRDSAALLDATAGYEPGAPYGLMCQSGGYLAATRRSPGKLKIALNLTVPHVAIHADCLDAVKRTGVLLETLGHTVEEATPPLNYDRLNEVQNILMATGVANMLRQIGEVRGRPVEVPEIEPMTRMVMRAGENYSQFDYVTALEEMHGMGRTMGRFLGDYDLILQPVTATPAPKLNTIIYRDGDSLEQYTRRFKQVSAFTHLYNMSGQPSMSLPLAFSETGLPIGVMISGRVGADAQLFSLAAQLEKSPMWNIPVPPINATNYPQRNP